MAREERVIEHVPYAYSIIGSYEDGELVRKTRVPGVDLARIADGDQKYIEAVEAARRQRKEELAQRCIDAALANVQPNPDYADVTARSLAREAVEYALKLKELPLQEQGDE